MNGLKWPGRDSRLAGSESLVSFVFAELNLIEANEPYGYSIFIIQKRTNIPDRVDWTAALITLCHAAIRNIE